MKKAVSIIVILIILWSIAFFIDYLRCSNFKEPIFVVAKDTADDGGSGTYCGLGYKVEIEKTISAEFGLELVKVEMYVGNKFITGAIADSNSSANDSYQTIEEEQYEFIGTIIDVYNNSIIVEPEEGSNERKSSDKISMVIKRPTDSTNDFYVVGNKVKITYNGVIMESYPAQIIATKVELVGGETLTIRKRI